MKLYTRTGDDGTTGLFSGTRVSKDHPRIELLRRKGLMAGRDFPLAKWMYTKAAVGKVRDAWEAATDMNAWLDLHVGPSTLPPEEWRR